MAGLLPLWRSVYYAIQGLVQRQPHPFVTQNLKIVEECQAQGKSVQDTINKLAGQALSHYQCRPHGDWIAATCAEMKTFDQLCRQLRKFPYDGIINMDQHWENIKKSQPKK